jgi:hypothetical protein
MYVNSFTYHKITDAALHLAPQCKTDRMVKAPRHAFVDLSAD